MPQRINNVHEWTLKQVEEGIKAKTLTKRDVVVYLQQNNTLNWLKDHHLDGPAKQLSKTIKSEFVIGCFNEYRILMRSVELEEMKIAEEEFVEAVVPPAITPQSKKMGGGKAVTLSDIPLDYKVQVGVYSRAGTFHSNEDRFMVVEDFKLCSSSGTVESGPPHSFFALADGHGGFMAAEFCTSRIPQLLACARALRKGDVGLALTQAIRRTEKEFCKWAYKDGDFSGSCVCCAILRGSRLTVANVGDCRALFQSGGLRYGDRFEGNGMPLNSNSKESYITPVASLSAFSHSPLAGLMGQPPPQQQPIIPLTNIPALLLQMSDDHKATSDRERRRIEAAGGWVTGGRALGVLLPSRTIGDVDSKHKRVRGAVVAEPEVMETRITLGNEPSFLIIASDGIWDFLSTTQVARLAHSLFIVGDLFFF
eukprot:TRINITY_DN1970_c0_g1_i2.p1 TRINITY_DN1970_c0_g1~~TRINITY_DN1970_c0_g1_i2.p1  ORF type:complete len:423 (+),score=96.95 TRINITY_DN1970_c0_g1_i2:135-1403(+)